MGRASQSTVEAARAAASAGSIGLALHYRLVSASGSTGSVRRQEGNMGSFRARSLAALLWAALAACHTGGTSTLVGATTMTALAMGSAVAERAAGGWIALCTHGTACNPQTGLCEALPRRNQCSATEHCEQPLTGDKCMPGAPTGVE